MKTPLLSIIIVNWNGRKWLTKCLDSLLKQTYRDYEIILVDNASADDSVQFIRNQYPSVTIITCTANLGFSGGNNLGVNNAKGELILLLNNDTWIEVDFLDKLLKWYFSHEYDVVAPVETPYTGGMASSFSTLTDVFGHPVRLNRRKKSFYLSGVCLLFSKKLYKETKGLDPNFFMYFEETDWFWRLNLLDKKYAYCDDDINVYHAGAGSTGAGIKYNSFLWRNQNTLQMLLKNYAWYNLVWVLPVYVVQNLVELLIFLAMMRPKISWSYVQGWLFNIKHIRRTLNQRKWIQENRAVSDVEIIKKMYFGFGKINHFVSFIKATGDRGK